MNQLKPSSFWVLKGRVYSSNYTDGRMHYLQVTYSVAVMQSFYQHSWRFVIKFRQNFFKQSSNVRLILKWKTKVNRQRCWIQQYWWSVVSKTASNAIKQTNAVYSPRQPSTVNYINLTKISFKTQRSGGARGIRLRPFSPWKSLVLC